MDKQEMVYQRLEELKVQYSVSKHSAVYTIEEMEAQGIHREGDVVKNLFLRDAKGKRHFLIVLDKDKKADLEGIRQQIGSTALSFASEERLEKYLRLSKGAVSPFGLLNDNEILVEVFFDKALVGKEKLGVHPNDNTATVWISFDSLKRVLEESGHSIKYIAI